MSNPEALKEELERHLLSKEPYKSVFPKVHLVKEESQLGHHLEPLYFIVYTRGALPKNALFDSFARKEYGELRVHWVIRD